MEKARAPLVRIAFATGAALLAVGVAYAIGFLLVGGVGRAGVALVASVVGLCVLVPAGFALAMLR